MCLDCRSLPRRKGDKRRDGGQDLSPMCELKCLHRIHQVERTDERRAGEARFLCNVPGLVMPYFRFGSLHCRIGVIPREGVAINLLHYAVIISVRLLGKLTVLCALILFKRKWENKSSRSNINGP